MATSFSSGIRFPSLNRKSHFISVYIHTATEITATCKLLHIAVMTFPFFSFALSARGKKNTTDLAASSRSCDVTLICVIELLLTKAIAIVQRNSEISADYIAALAMQSRFAAFSCITSYTIVSICGNIFSFCISKADL